MAKKQLEPIHPGEVLLEEFMRPLNRTAYRLAKDIRVPAIRISEITRGKRSISADTALRLGRYFRVSPQLWINLQGQYDLRVAKMKLGKRLEEEVDPIAA